MPALEEVIEPLLALDELRSEVIDLHKEAVDVLLGVAKGRRAIKLEGDHISQATALAALQLAARQGAREDPEKEREFLAGLRSLPLSVLLSRHNLKDEHGGRVPLLVAARVLRALALSPGEGLSRAALCCYYRMARELYTPSPPDFMTGGVRAGERGMATAFQTGECVRAILTLMQMLERTAQTFECIQRWRRDTERFSHPAIPKAWQDHERLRVRQVLRAQVKVRQRDLGFNSQNLVDSLDQDGEIKASNLRMAVLDAVREVRGGFDEAIQECEAERKKEEATSGWERSASAHFQALASLKNGRDVTAHQVELIDKDDWTAAAHTLREEVSRIRQLLRPAEHFLRSVLAREIAEASADDQHHTCDYPELAFAAAAYGLLRYGRRHLNDVATAWDHPHLKRAARILVDKMSANGLFPVGRPLTVDPWGQRLEVVGVEVTHAVCEVLRNVECDFDTEVVRKMLRLFHDTRDHTTGGWGYEQMPPPVEAQYWTTGLSTIALHAMHGMLEANIRRSVLCHFSVRWPKKIDLDNAFYPDIGLAMQRPSLGTYFQLMREHMMGIKGRTAERICSLVLYGPPGTGKTTLPEALAASTDSPVVEITPSDLVSSGANLVERRSRIVFQALSLLSDAVILFDEFDSVLRRRVQGGKLENVFELLTPGLLPKLKNLHERAESARIAYVLSTNLVGSLDEAAIRDGRFDARVGVYAPDVVSRTGRLLAELVRYGKIEIAGATLDRVATVVHASSSGGMTQLGKPGWFTAPGKVENRTPFHFIETGAESSRPTKLGQEKQRPPFPEGQGRSAELEWQEWTMLDRWDDLLGARPSWFDLKGVVEERPARPDLPRGRTSSP